MLENVRHLDLLLHPTRGMREVLDQLCPVIRKYLADIPRDAPLTTGQLVERIYPIALAKKEGHEARTRFFQVLMYAAPRDLSDCAMRGPARRMRGKTKTIKPWLWCESGDKNEEAAVLDRRRSELHFQKALKHTFGFAVRRLGFVDAKRLADAVIAIYDDPTMAALEAGDLKNEASQQGATQ